MDEKKAFITGVILHIFLIWTRINIFPFRSFGCVNQDCSSIIVSDIPLSIIYLAFPDVLLILFSLVFGSLLWGVYFLILYKILFLIFKD